MLQELFVESSSSESGASSNRSRQDVQELPQQQQLAQALAYEDDLEVLVAPDQRYALTNEEYTKWINDKIKNQVGLSIIAEQYDESDGHSKYGQELSMSHEA